MGLLQNHGWLFSIGVFEVFLAPIVLLASVALYRIYFHPLAHIPGPAFACVSPLFLYAICFWGVEGRVLRHYHAKYDTPVLRISPDSVSLSDGEALHQVYVAEGGLPKDARYSNFRVEGHDTIFSTLDKGYRDQRAKVVLPLFAPGRIQSAFDKDGVIGPLVKKFVARLREKKKSSQPRVDVLDLSSRLSLDVLTAYLFHTVYGGLDEPSHDQPASRMVPEKAAPSASKPGTNKLSATPFVLAIVAFSRFSLLPNWLFNVIFSFFFARMLSDNEVKASLLKVSQFAEGVVDHDVSSGHETYQARLKTAGHTRDETLVQCKAVMFAGADSEAVITATILFHLVQQPAVRRRLHAEMAQHPAGADPQSVPYLRAVVREGLRLGMANPARLTRIVPATQAGGMCVSGFYLPPGTKVGAAAYVLHHDPTVYPEPFAFVPERWLPAADEPAAEWAARRLRERNMLPYGLGARACLGRNLANHQLYYVLKEVMESDVLEGARTCAEKIDIIEWFNAEIRGHELEIEW
ncbi:cytochrome P450 [Xylariaceae sp. FL0804]|nr:cytochrome P450 [Xylariaceae sp. FL0804]